MPPRLMPVARPGGSRTGYAGERETRDTFGGDAATFHVLDLFQETWQFLHPGYAAARTWLLTPIVVVVTLIQVKPSNRLV
ncbi:hypothetical protein ACFQZ8_25705 [Micromonospora azadirachtae]|uniref:Uncharacterized protein n=1 Tax=Micromonospora azadirachtae TaxID=1970735 RepID=A0ABW3A9A6_9ACTN